MIRIFKIYFLFVLLSGGALLSALPSRAQQSQSGSAVQEANKDLQKQTDKVNKAVESGVRKVTDKVDSKMEAANEKVSSGVEKLKAATIKKNTWLMRSYHNLTAYYNVYFNANDSYDEGVKKSAKEYPFDYSQILPVFTFGAKEIPQMVTSEMQRALEKSDKTIKKHSLTTKPEIKKGKRLSKKEQEFYNKREFCKSIDDAYLLIGKANVYLHEYDLAAYAFDLVATDYSKEPTAYEARLWNAIMAGEQSNVEREQEILTALANDKNFPKEYRKLLNRANADLLIRQKKYGEAIPKVEQAIKSANSRTNRLRYHFILGQLYQKIGVSYKAVEHYTSVIRRMPPYEMEFHAQLNKAFLSIGNEGESMRKLLEKMAKDEKNKDYLNQIYFALAGIEMHANRTEQAIAYYRLSAAHSKSESPQRVLSCFTLAKYYEGQGDYESAQAYYDSTAMVMPKDNPDYEMVSNKAQNLGKLAVNLRVIKTEDSLQRVARMSPAERDKYVEKQIAQAKADEEKRQRSEEIKLAREAAAAEAASAFTKPTSGKWYFYNEAIVAKGLAEFKRTWGNRALVDGWRRASKSIVNEFPGMDEPDKSSEENQTPVTETAEYYLENVPLTDSLMEESNKRLVEALFDAGMVYKDYILDRPHAIEMLEELLKRFPYNKYKLESYFYLYVLNSEEKKTARAEHYKNLLVKEFPDELLTKYVLDPKHVSDTEKKNKEANSLYSQAYELYNGGKYRQAVALTEQGLQRYPEMGIAANFKLLQVMAQGSNGNIGQYIAGLGEVVKAYPDTDAAKAAKEMQNIVQKRELQLMTDRETVSTKIDSAPSVIYSTTDGESVLALLVPKGTNMNQLKFNFMSFNADIDADALLVTSQAFSSELEMVTVSSFKSIAEAYGYYKKVSNFPAIFKDLNLENHSMFAITQNNLALLEQNKIISTYAGFFQTNIAK